MEEDVVEEVLLIPPIVSIGEFYIILAGVACCFFILGCALRKTFIRDGQRENSFAMREDVNKHSRAKARDVERGMIQQRRPQIDDSELSEGFDAASIRSKSKSIRRENNTARQEQKNIQTNSVIESFTNDPDIMATLRSLTARKHANKGLGSRQQRPAVAMITDEKLAAKIRAKIRLPSSSPDIIK